MSALIGGIERYNGERGGLDRVNPVGSGEGTR